MAFNPDTCLLVQNVATVNNTFSFKYSGYGTQPGYKYYFSKDGVNWSESITLKPNECAFVKGTNFPFTGDQYSYKGYQLNATQLFDIIGGSVFSLVNDGDGGVVNMPYGAFERVFAGSKVRKVTANILPSTNLSEECYLGMFSNCSSLTEVPETLLPATVLKRVCYYGMFDGCRSLVQPPHLPARNSAEYCYGQMFRYCTSLTRICVNLANFGDTPEYGPTREWMWGVDTTGKFYYSEITGGVLEWGPNGQPRGWDRVRNGYYPPTPPTPRPPTPSNPEVCFRIEVLEDNTAIALPPVGDNHFMFSTNKIIYQPDSIVANAGDTVYVYGNAYPS